MANHGITSDCFLDGIGVRSESTNLVSNKHIFADSNFCSNRVYPGTTPPGTPDQDDEDDEDDEDEDEEEPRPGMLQRTLSLTRGDKPGGGLLRRLSGRGPPPTRDFNLGGKTNSAARRMSMDGPFPPATADESHYPRPSHESTRPGIFRRPTNLSRSASKKSTKSSTKAAAAATAAAGADDGEGGMINLEGGLAITLNLELNCKDPSGITTPYKLLVPMLRYDGVEYDPPATQVTKGWRKWLSVRRKKKEDDASTNQTGSADEKQNPAENGGVYNDHDEDEDEESDEEDYPEYHNWNQHRNGEEDEDEEDDSEESDGESPEQSKKKEKGTSKRRKWFGFG